ncbi:MAG: glycosyltransferase family 4 protein [Isosphaeraceae bacterium]|nr:glycosyltransferase family 4 protein [Isosphaeraceae bacterium]
MIHYTSTHGIGNAWIAAELEIMERKGIPFELHSLHRNHQDFFGNSWATRLAQDTNVIYPVRPGAFLKSVVLAPFLFRERFLKVCRNAFFGKRENLRVRLVGILHIFVASHWARQLRDKEVSHIHAQWCQASGTLAMYGSWLLGIPFSFTGHAADLFRERFAFEDKIRNAEFIVCISSFHRELYKQHGARDEQLVDVFCGIDTDQFPYAFHPIEGGRPRILSVGRLVEKKGFDVLIDACGILRDRGVDFECVIAGDGPLESSLRDQVIAADLVDRVQLTGRPILQGDLPRFLSTGHLFAQPCVWARDQDVDGTPRTLMEAMACGIPSISTRLVGIPDIIEDGIAGLLVEPRDAVGLADAMERIISDPALAERLSKGGRERMERLFQIDVCLETLAQLYRERLGRIPKAIPPPKSLSIRTREESVA